MKNCLLYIRKEIDLGQIHITQSNDNEFEKKTLIIG